MTATRGAMWLGVEPATLAAARHGRGSAQPTAALPHPEGGPLPRWRALLEARWQVRLQQVTELSLAFHDAAAAVAASTGSGDAAEPSRRRMRDLLWRTVAARRGLADVEEALARLETGRFGRCEQCAAAIPAATLAHTPEERYCPGCTSAARGGRA
jgi:RNA polymerase-binding transcription factor